jgi:hypothetical protein
MIRGQAGRLCARQLPHAFPFHGGLDVIEGFHGSFSRTVAFGTASPSISGGKPSAVAETDDRPFPVMSLPGVVGGPRANEPLAVLDSARAYLAGLACE